MQITEWWLSTELKTIARASTSTSTSPRVGIDRSGAPSSPCRRIANFIAAPALFSATHTHLPPTRSVKRASAAAPDAYFTTCTSEHNNSVVSPTS